MDPPGIEDGNEQEPIQNIKKLKVENKKEDEQDDDPISKVTDKFVISVMKEFARRSIVGTEKYGTTLERTDLSINDWLQHGKEEAMDLIDYIQKLQDYIEEFESLEVLKKYTLEELVEIVREYEKTHKKI